jgi:hypothetical protein
MTWLDWAKRFRGNWIIRGNFAERVGIPFDPAQFKIANDRAFIGRII